MTELPSGEPGFSSRLRQDFFLRSHVQIGSETHPISTEISFSDGKVVRAWNWPLTSISTDVCNVWNFTSFPYNSLKHRRCTFDEQRVEQNNITSLVDSNQSETISDNAAEWLTFLSLVRM
jgi:hypothetical protein